MILTAIFCFRSFCNIYFLFSSFGTWLVGNSTPFSFFYGMILFHDPVHGFENLIQVIIGFFQGLFFTLILVFISSFHVGFFLKLSFKILFDFLYIRLSRFYHLDHRFDELTHVFFLDFFKIYIFFQLHLLILCCFRN